MPNCDLCHGMHDIKMWYAINIDDGEGEKNGLLNTTQQMIKAYNIEESACKTSSLFCPLSFHFIASNLCTFFTLGSGVVSDYSQFQHTHDICLLCPVPFSPTFPCFHFCPFISFQCH